MSQADIVTNETSAGAEAIAEAIADAQPEQTADGADIIEIPGTGWKVDPAEVIEIELRPSEYNSVAVKTRSSGSYILSAQQGAPFTELAGREFSQVSENVWRRISAVG